MTSDDVIRPLYVGYVVICPNVGKLVRREIGEIVRYYDIGYPNLAIGRNCAV